MVFEYAFVHIKYTIPPALVLSLLYRPLFTKLDVYKIVFLISIAVISTTPWDSYLIRNDIWSYPPTVILGQRLFKIPIEEVFFFVIQTYTTSLVYLILNKPTFHPAYLQVEKDEEGNVPGKPEVSVWKLYKLLGQAALAAVSFIGWVMINDGQRGTYMGLILGAAGPVLLFLWSLAYQFIIGLPLTNTVIPILLPTLYLWIVDTFALRRGTWAISGSTKFDIYVWDGLEIEEAVFFLLTNTLIVFGLLAFDNALAILSTFPSYFHNLPTLPSPLLLIQVLFLPTTKYDEPRIRALRDAVTRLRAKSRSFYLASSTFQGRVRADLLLLYSFCRVADDLVDEASSQSEAREWIACLRGFLKLNYGTSQNAFGKTAHIENNFPPETRSALKFLPDYLSEEPLTELLAGFEMDLGFENQNADGRWRAGQGEGEEVIRDERDLELYAERVAGTVARMCLEVIFHNCESDLDAVDQKRVVDAGTRMGVALQYVNIARDIEVDARMGRVYLPATWLKEKRLHYRSVLENSGGGVIQELRSRLLDMAFEIYAQARGAIEELPTEVRGPMRVAVESYMEIGRVLRETGYTVKAGKATVPKFRRLRVAWNAAG